MKSLPRCPVQAVDLAGRLALGLVVAPDHVAPRPGVDRVVAVAAEQLVVARRGSARRRARLQVLVEAALVRLTDARRVLVQPVARVRRIDAAERVVPGARVERAALVALVHEQHAVDARPAGVARVGDADARPRRAAPCAERGRRRARGDGRAIIVMLVSGEPARPARRRLADGHASRAARLARGRGRHGRAGRSSRGCRRASPELPLRSGRAELESQPEGVEHVRQRASRVEPARRAAVTVALGRAASASTADADQQREVRRPGSPAGRG